MPIENLYIADVSAAGVVSTPPFRAFCVRALPCRGGGAPILRVRSLNGTGFALKEQNVPVDADWQTISQAVNPTAWDDSARALEVVAIYDGYVFFHTGSVPGTPFDVDSEMSTDAQSPLSTMLMPGDILSVASYVRPMHWVLGRAAILTRPIYELPTADIAAGTYIYNSVNTATVLVPPGTTNKMELDLGLQTGLASTKVTVNIRSSEIDYDANTSYLNQPAGAAVRVGEPTPWAEIVALTQGVATTRLSYHCPRPDPGRYRVELQLITDKVLTGTASRTFLQLFHRVYR